MKYWIAFLLGAAPIIEVRGAIPYAVASGIPTPWLFIIPVLGNIMIIPFVLYLFEPIAKWISKNPKLGKVTEAINHYEKRALSKAGNVQTLEMLGLFLFVAIPIPGTGAWTGSVIAVLLKMKKSRSFIACALGVLAATLVMYLISIGVLNIFK